MSEKSFPLGDAKEKETEVGIAHAPVLPSERGTKSDADRLPIALPETEGARSTRTTETPIEGTLKERPPTSRRRIGWGSTSPEFLQLQDDGASVFKPKDNEVDLRDNVRPGTFYKRERAAYLVSKFLGFELVPPTVIREVDGQIGSVQQFVEDAKGPYEIPSGAKLLDRWPEELMRLWLFDLIIWNSDRHDGNLLFKNDRACAIDNGLSFGNDKPRLYSEYPGRALPQGTVNQVREFFSWEHGQRILEDLLCELLPKEEVQAFFSRLEQIKKQLLEVGVIEKVEYS
ncbi:MAG: hypothetical protein A3I44_01015 [Candidatus Sungbacteria bacterium RIFCSPLOWO2_02_FULL_51_17]|uniref:PI3K/PI4K catalytic domain-containing protein n=1 Tax=Candidatus Sungbacteria bacterium RIFCSPHIGHO2_02_FULL_51_29 TaxID=1802273 RepID=A0A1G2KWL5_9BACT|nr:MAG: hypothetical protein A2676_00415 [Candidatus Sungbacteria bacterium RIFCSPHIGHO2_01_FULL_51_22]OHA03803.1 MAG: hypothetical protein A3C16_05085 [Candidatus Sungbacteria bacterium RIFCSPHIGHO2_02_FULL_51_29]OHA07447.1 MAG: hypothetical protein A3B29_02170 [Candidatus Sungbacteria bacterium RIFCSPLOWO2_01_FULL_51_34]OHA10959.1 MAG: hypothetical protein A3I44_01015 [Candidatus Sungbacteria bacterium RIFCSPLOWO2_02_FULL_51_17]